MWTVISINTTNQCSSLSVHWKYYPTCRGRLRLHSGPAERIGLCCLKFVLPTHEGVGVAVSKSRKPLCEQRFLSAILLSAAQRGWVARPPRSHSPLKSTLQTGKLRPPQGSVLGPAIWAVDKARSPQSRVLSQKFYQIHF